MMNEKLIELYTQHWDNLSNGLNQIIADDKYKIKPANPLLISLTDVEKFESADIRVMIIGQENNGWEGIFSNNMNYLLSVYRDFAPVSGEYKHKGYFRDHFNLFTTMIKKKFENKKVSWIWNNLIKISKHKDIGVPPSYIYDIEKLNFKVLKEEIQIIKPNLILFYTGPYYDNYIKIHFPENTKESINGFKPNQLVKIHIDGINNVFRTYHPGYLNRLKNEGYSKIYNAIIDNSVF